MSTPRVSGPPFDTGFRSADTPEDRSRWNGKKEVLYDLYIRQKQTLDKVKAIMETDFGFPTALRLSDYEHVLREVFKYRKNLSTDDWRLSIGPRIAKRKAEDKLSEVLLNGCRVENVDRRIQRSLRSKRTRRCVEAHSAELPYGVIVRTPPASPNLSALTSSIPPGRDSEGADFERLEDCQSFTHLLTGYEAELDQLRSLMDVIPYSEGCPGGQVSSAQLWREGCPINDFIIMLNIYRHRFEHAGPRLFGPNTTMNTLGKICFDFSNNLHHESLSRRDLTLALDWIGFHADRAFLKTFFAQKDLTILATWEALNSTVLDRQHAAALDTLLHVHLAIRNTAPWVEGRPRRRLLHYLKMAPKVGSELIKTYPCDQSHLSWEFKDAMRNQDPIEVVSLLISAGVSLPSDDLGASVDEFIRYLGSQEYPVVGLAFLKRFLEDGAVVDAPPEVDYRDVGWYHTGRPIYATDYLLLSESDSPHKTDFVSLVCSHSDRQQTTVTVPGIFEASQAGHAQLRFYLNARSIPPNEDGRMLVLEIALSEASARGHADVSQTLIRFGVDPNVRMLSKDAKSWYEHHESEPRTWHPVIQAVDAEKVDVLQIMVTTPDIDVSLIEEELRWLDYFDPGWCPPPEIDDTKLDHILRLLSNLDFSLITRKDFLVYALRTQPYGSGNGDPDFGLADRLLELGLASTLQDHKDVKDPQDHVLVRALTANCGISALNFLVERDMRILCPVQSSTIAELFKITASRQGASEAYAILELLAQKAEGFMAHVQEQKSHLLRAILQHSDHGPLESYCWHGNGENECKCGIMGATKWLLGLGATLDIRDLTSFVSHASETFTLGMVESMPDIDAVDKLDALMRAIIRRQFKLAMALIERGVLINDPVPAGPGRLPVAQSVLQQACETRAPLWFIRYLIDKGADVNGPPDPHNGWTALQMAAGRGLMNVVELLLNCGADVNALSGRVGNSPRVDGTNFMRAIDVAALLGRLDMAHFLIKAGARSGRPGKTGFDGAIALATAQRHSAIAALLQKQADSGREERMEAERRWLLANPHACMDNGKITPRTDLSMSSDSECGDDEVDSEA